MQYALLPSLQSGALIEVALTDPNAPGMPCGTWIVSIHTLAHVDATGIFLECTFVGFSSPTMAPVLGALFATPFFGAVLHLCFNAAGFFRVGSTCTR